MKKIFIILLGCIFLAGTGWGVWFLMNRKATASFQQVFSNADTMQFTFTEKDTKKVYKKTIQYQPQIWLVASTITNTNVPNIKCDFYSSVQFFSKGKALLSEPAALNLDPECQQIAFLYNGKVYHKRLLNEGIEYIAGLEAEAKK